MGFTVLVPARLASTRLPRKPLADIAGVPMVVRVAQRSARSGASRVVVAADHVDILAACAAFDVQAILTREDHASGSDRLAQACQILGLDGADIVVNVQGDEPLIDPASIDACAGLLDQRSDCVVATAAHAIDTLAELDDPNVVKVVLDRAGRALYFSRAPIPWWRDARGRADPADPAASAHAVPSPRPLRHIGLYAYRAGFLRRFNTLAASPLEAIESLEQLRVLWHGERIAVHVSDSRPGPGVDTAADLERVRAMFG
ncbi:MAG: 3-deoxy-manno-octulosonate cytidylyltransferase [Burkholderiaceae bacterium]